MNVHPVQPNAYGDRTSAFHLFVHPEDVDLPAVKASAAELDITVVASTVVPRGQMYLWNQAWAPVITPPLGGTP